MNEISNADQRTHRSILMNSMPSFTHACETSFGLAKVPPEIALTKASVKSKKLLHKGTEYPSFFMGKSLCLG